MEIPFQDRLEAGRLLGAELATRERITNPIVLALPRGGVQVGIEVAEALNAPLDIIVVRKLGVPWQRELAMGAIAGTTRVLDRELIREFRISEAEIDAVAAREIEEIERREKLYRGGLPPPDLHDRTAILIDDGLATGSTMVAAARHVRMLEPQKLIIAVPVGSPQACSRLAEEADECVCLATPEPFVAVGAWYTDFQQVTDAQVQEMLRRGRASTETGR